MARWTPGTAPRPRTPPPSTSVTYTTAEAAFLAAEMALSGPLGGSAATAKDVVELVPTLRGGGDSGASVLEQVVWYGAASAIMSSKFDDEKTRSSERQYTSGYRVEGHAMPDPHNVTDPNKVIFAGKTPNRCALRCTSKSSSDAPTSDGTVPDKLLYDTSTPLNDAALRRDRPGEGVVRQV